MDLGMVGLGRMGRNMAVRLVRGGHRVVGTDRDPAGVREAEQAGVGGAADLDALLAKLPPPRAVWLMVPVGPPVESLVQPLSAKLSKGDAVIDGGHSDYRDDDRRARLPGHRRIAFVD